MIGFLKNLQITHLTLVIRENVIIILFISGIFFLIAFYNLDFSLFLDTFRHLFIDGFDPFGVFVFDFGVPPIFEQHHPFIFKIGIIFKVTVSLRIDFTGFGNVLGHFKLGITYPDLKLEKHNLK